MAICRSESQVSSYIQHLVELQADGGPGLLRYLILDGKIEVVSTVKKSFQRALVLSEHGGSDARDVVQIDPAQREMTEVFGGADLDPADLREVRLVCPAEEAG